MPRGTPSSNTPNNNKSPQHAKRQDLTHLLPPTPHLNNSYVNNKNNNNNNNDYDDYDNDDDDEIKSRNVNQYERQRRRESLAQLRPAAAAAALPQLQQRLTPRPVRRNPALPVVLSWSFFLIITTLSFALNFPLLWKKEYRMIIFADIIVFIYTISNLMLVILSDPGFYECFDGEILEDIGFGSSQRVIHIKNSLINVNYCETCKFFRPPRTHHCSKCNKCVEKMDHHCTLLAACVGVRNYKFFVLYLGCLTLHMILNIAIFTLVIIILPLKDYRSIISIINVITTAILLFPVAWMFISHNLLITYNETTFETTTQKFEMIENPFANSCLKSYALLFLTPIRPSFLSYNRKSYVKKKRFYVNYLPDITSLYHIIPGKLTPSDTYLLLNEIEDEGNIEKNESHNDHRNNVQNIKSIDRKMHRGKRLEDKYVGNFIPRSEVISFKLDRINDKRRET